MQWLEKIRNKPRDQKMQIIWALASVCIIIMVALWIITAQLQKPPTSDNALSQFFHNFKTWQRDAKEVLPNK